MPNSNKGVFYYEGKFHISKLASDTVEFVAGVHGLGHHDGQGAAQDLSSALVSPSAFPTSQQVVDFVSSQITSNATYTLDAGSSSSNAGEAFAYTAETNASEKVRLDNMFAQFADLIAQAASSSEGRDSAEETARQNADAAIQSELDVTQGSAGFEADGTYTAHSGSNYIDGGASLKAVDLLLDGAIKSVSDALAQEVTDRTNEDAAIQSELDVTQSGAGLNTDGTYTADVGADYISGATSLKEADSLLDDQIKANFDAIAAEESARTGADNDLRDDVDQALGVTIPNFSVQASGTAQDNGYNTAFNGAGDVKTALEALDSAIFAMLAGSTVDLDNLKELVDAYEAMDSDVFNMVSGIFGLTGMVSTPALAADGTADENISLTYSGTDYIDAATSLKNADELLDAAIKANADAITAEVGRAQGAETALGLRIDAVNTAAGLVGDNYQAVGSRDFIGQATSLDDADAKLDAALKAEETRAIGAEGDLQFNNLVATDLTAAINELEGLTANQNSNVQAELDATQLAIGFAAPDPQGASDAERDGYHLAEIVAPNASQVQFVKVFSDQAAGSSFPSIISSIMQAVQNASEALEQEDADLQTQIDDEVAARQNADSAIQVELDNTQAGAGLDADGGYTADGSTNYLQTASGLKDADSKLDAQLKISNDAIAQEVSDRQSADTSIRTDAQTSLGQALGGWTNSGTNYIDAAGNVSASLVALDSAIAGVASAQEDDLTLEIAGVANGVIDLDTEALDISGGDTGTAAGSQNIRVHAPSGNGKGFEIDLVEAVEVVSLSADGQVRSAISASTIAVQHEPFQAATAWQSQTGDGIKPGYMVSLHVDNTTSQYNPQSFKIQQADITNALSTQSIMGMAFDPQSVTGIIEPDADLSAGPSMGFPKDGTVAIIKGGQTVRFDDADASLTAIFADQNLASQALDYDVGDALYVSYEINNGVVMPILSKEIPYDQDAASNPTGADIDVKAVYYVGFVLETKQLANQTIKPQAIWFDPKLIAMEG